jgi:hypothetical protein
VGVVREGRPKSAGTLQNIDDVREVIIQDRYSTYMHDHLTVKMICSRWIPHNSKEARVGLDKMY